MIFLQMVNALRHYPVANAVAQTFPHPVILNETGLPAALTIYAVNNPGSFFHRSSYCSRKQLAYFASFPPCTRRPAFFRSSELILVQNCPNVLRWFIRKRITCE